MNDESNLPEIPDEEYHRAWKQEKDPDVSILRNLAYEIAALRDHKRSVKGRVDAAAFRTSLCVDCKTVPKRDNGLFVCYTLVAGIKVGFGKGDKLKRARTGAYNDTIQKLLLPYMRVIQTSPSEKKLEASFQSFSSHDPDHNHDESESKKEDPCSAPMRMMKCKNNHKSKAISLDGYRDLTESLPEWLMRKEFLATNLDSLPPDRLICLSKCFVNMFFYGCLYPQATMNEIQERSHGIFERKEKQIKAIKQEGYKNSFVRACGDEEPYQSTYDNNNIDKHSICKKTVDIEKAEVLDARSSNKRLRISNIDMKEDIGPSAMKTCKLEKRVKKSDRKRKKGNKSIKSEFLLPVQTKDNEKLSGNSNKKLKKEKTSKPLKELILLHNVAALSSHQILNESTGFSRMVMRFDYELDKSSLDPQSTCHVVINNQIIASTTGVNKAACKTEACNIALNKLRKVCWQIQVKQDNRAKKIIAREDFSIGNHKGYDIPVKNDIVNRIMQKMGWTGGGLGKHGSGAVEPVSFSCNQIQFAAKGHEGLGFKSCSDFDKAKVVELLENYANDPNNTYDLTFSKDFSNQERHFIHTQCSKLHLHSKCGLTGKERYLIVGRKWTPSTLFNHIQELGGETEKYLLIAPNTNLDKPLITGSDRDIEVPGNDASTKTDNSEIGIGSKVLYSKNVETVDMSQLK